MRCLSSALFVPVAAGCVCCLAIAADAAAPVAASRTALSRAAATKAEPGDPRSEAPGGGHAGPLKTISATANAPKTPALTDLEETDTVSQYGITWKFDKKVRVGQFITGDWYVIGPVTVTKVDPAPVYGENAHNGSMLNPRPSEFNGYARMPAQYYKEDLQARFPLHLQPGDSVVSTITLDQPRQDQAALKSAAVLTCLAEPVSPDTFRPPYCGGQVPRHRYRDLRLDLLPAYAPVDSAPPITNYAQRFGRPWIDHAYDMGSTFVHPRDNMPVGGDGIAQSVSIVSLLLMCDYPMEQKKPLLIGLVQYGIDLDGAIRRGLPGWPAHGHRGSGRKWPILFAGLLLGDENLQHPKAEFGEEQQTAFGTSWTHANAVFTGMSGPDSQGRPERGEFEHLHPSEWHGMGGENYRRTHTTYSWVGFTLAARMMHAEETWDHGALFAYVDRWMSEDDAENLKTIRDSAEPMPGAGDLQAWYTDYSRAFARQRQARIPFVADMWARYRQAPGLAPSGYHVVAAVHEGGVTREPNGTLRVRGRPFFPLMLFRQTPDGIPFAKAAGINTFFDNGWTYDGGAPHDNRALLNQLAEQDLYGVFGADTRLAGRDHLLGWRQANRPDEPQDLREPNIALGAGMKPSLTHYPPAQMVDSDLSTAAQLDPLDGAEVTLRRARPITIAEVVVSMMATEDVTAAKDIELSGDGNLLLKTTLRREDGWQRIALTAPSTIQALTLKVLSTYPSRGHPWGYLREIKALDANGQEVPLYEVRRVPRRPVKALSLTREWLKSVDSSRPVFMMLTDGYAAASQSWNAETKHALYGELLKLCDIAVIDLRQTSDPAAVASAVREFGAVAGPQRAVCVFVPASGGAAAIRARVWAAIVAGASGIGYGLPDESAPDGLLTKALRQIHGRVTSLAPAILANIAPVEARMSMAGDAPCHLKATQDGDHVYLFAQNLSPTESGEGTLRVSGLKAGTIIDVIDEKRTVTAQDSRFTDGFDRLAEHLYRFKP